MPVSPTAPVLSAAALAGAYTYQAYRQLIDDLLAEGKATGPKQSEELTAYSALNVQRMQRLDKTVHVQPALAADAKTTSGSSSPKAGAATRPSCCPSLRRWPANHTTSAK